MKTSSKIKPLFFAALAGLLSGTPAHAWDDTYALGSGAHTIDSDAFALGTNSTAFGAASYAIGFGANATGISAFAIGADSFAPWDYSIVLGSYPATNTTVGTPLLVVANGTYSTPANVMTILTDGRVGIGAVDPVAQLQIEQNYYGGSVGMLHLVSSGSEAGISMEKNAYDFQRISFKLGDNSLHTSDFYIRAEYPGGGAARLTIESGSGNIGVGTTSPAAKLDVDGDVIIQGDLVTLIGRTIAVSFAYTNIAVSKFQHCVVGNSSSNLTLTLPTTPENGREFIFGNRNSGNVTLNATSSGGFLTPGGITNNLTLTTGQTVIAIYDSVEWIVK